jgi:hypothetical protein
VVNLTGAAEIQTPEDPLFFAADLVEANATPQLWNLFRDAGGWGIAYQYARHLAYMTYGLPQNGTPRAECRTSIFANAGFDTYCSRVTARLSNSVRVANVSFRGEVLLFPGSCDGLQPHEDTQSPNVVERY